MEKCYIASDIAEDDTFPLGGNVLDERSHTWLRADFSNLRCGPDQPFFDRARMVFEKNDLSPKERYAQKQKFGGEPKSFAHLYFIQQFLHKWVSPHHMSKGEQKREGFYADVEMRSLSEAMAANQMACIEMSLIATKILQDQGKTVHIVGGWMNREEFPGVWDDGEAHAFVVLEEDNTDNLLIYDPANPLSTENGGVFPSIFVLSVDEFEHFLQKTKSRSGFMQVKEEFSGIQKLYGVGGGHMIDDSDIVVRAQNTVQADAPEGPVPPGQ